MTIRMTVKEVSTLWQAKQLLEQAEEKLQEISDSAALEVRAALSIVNYELDNYELID